MIILLGCIVNHTKPPCLLKQSIIVINVRVRRVRNIPASSKSQWALYLSPNVLLKTLASPDSSKSDDEISVREYIYQ